jgi:ATP-dependent helicase/nuclease subunit A
MVWPTGFESMSGSGSKIFPLVGDQRLAVTPDDNVWLSASAGTGKTQVLTARVFRLLLEPGVRPDAILCLTFTKAGASEMANRINSQLAAWVGMEDIPLSKDLRDIGASVSPDSLKRARRLFARVLDAPNGGLRIQTIHSFCQTLLAGFPMEAGISAGFKPMEDRDKMLLVRETLADMLTDAQKQGDSKLAANLEELSLRMGAEATEKFLLRCAAAPDAMDILQGDIRPWINAALELPRGADEDDLVKHCSDAASDGDALLQVAKANAAWDTKGGRAASTLLQEFLAASHEQRLEMLDDVLSVFLTKQGDRRKTSARLLALCPDYDELADSLVTYFGRIIELRQLLQFSASYSRALEAGRAFAYHFVDAKKRAGVMEFDDLIRMTAELLSQSAMADWIRYKMDQQFDHILVDESQDTNSRQWQIINGLISDFFAGEGSKPDRPRTLFTVGDFKQAIFGFQGTSPQNYAAAGVDIGQRAKAGERPFLQLALGRSFRSTQPVLDVVDRMLETIGLTALGLSDDEMVRHQGNAGPGLVELWRPAKIGAQQGDGDDEADEGRGDGDLPPGSSVDNADLEQWLSRADRLFAQQLAERIHRWIAGDADQLMWLSDKQGKPARVARAGDFMILLRKRGDLASLIVARLHALGVPVAGVDRLRLGQPLAVQDLMAAVRFASQPLDDLNLASLLVSPLLGFSQDDLLLYGYRKDKVSLWAHLRALARDDGLLAERIAPLREILNNADYGTPYVFLEQILSGPIQGRAKLVARLGTEALDPITELLNMAQQFERDHDANLQQFLNWFDRGDEEIKREISENSDAVRVLTVHGAKGLQAPVVILADCCSDPGRTPDASFDWAVDDGLGNHFTLPLYSLRKDERIGPLAAAYDAQRKIAMEEHYRLLYVAMTRAEERLYIGGTLATRANESPPSSWYALLDRALELHGCEWQISDDGTPCRAFGQGAKPAAEDTASGNGGGDVAAIPDWALQPASTEQRPPRPLAPSALGTDDVGASPDHKADLRQAAKRGIAMHSLFERLPDLPSEAREDAAHSWLQTQAGFADRADRDAMIASVLGVIDHPDWQLIFGPSALAEVPIAAVVGKDVVSGTIDRLVVEDDQISIIDFKTGRDPPVTLEAVPQIYIRQMAAYAQAVAKIYSGRTIKAALLYTHVPILLELPAALLEQVRFNDAAVDNAQARLL